MTGPRMATLAPTAAGLIALASCGDLLQEPDTGTIPVRVELEEVSGNAQEGVSGAPLAQLLRVRVLDEGEPASRLWVEWSVVAGGGEVEPRNTFSDENGVAQARWTLGPSAGTQQVRAVVRKGLPVIFEATSEDE
ncbi:MAG TPA: hypothetical protein VFH11_06350 [Gemmatimonadota bacterium]|nr:hypothetical protein [Gemmatimonadota bacterium]